MAKKSKRQSRKRAKTSQYTSPSMTASSAGKGYDDFNPDYSQTIKDLKRIGALAGSFFIILFGLAIYFRFVVY